MGQVWLVIASLSGAVGVMLGAFGAHALRGKLEPPARETFETAVRYQMYHVAALVAVAFGSTVNQSALIDLSGWAFVLGTLLFSGSLYLLVITKKRWLGAITPFGGIAIIVGWLLLAIAMIPG